MALSQPQTNHSFLQRSTLRLSSRNTCRPGENSHVINTFGSNTEHHMLFLNKYRLLSASPVAFVRMLERVWCHELPKAGWLSSMRYFEYVRFFSYAIFSYVSLVLLFLVYRYNLSAKPPLAIPTIWVFQIKFYSVNLSTLPLVESR